MAVFVIVLSGFLVTTRSDFFYILLGFTLGLVAVYAIERFKAADTKRQNQAIPRLFVSRPATRDS